MVVFPNCKINLGLNILEKRKDGYHNLETVFYPIPLNDILEIVTSENETDFKNTGISGGDVENNLCLKAYHLLKKDYPHLPKIKMHLHKSIPVGAGLGGGSADAAFALQLLNEKYDLQISWERLLVYASQLGSDCAFFLLNKPCFATGVGEKMEEIEFSLSAYTILLINPGIHISTKNLFKEISPKTPVKNIKRIIQQPIETWKDELKNDFEPVVFSKYPEIEKLKQALYNNKAIYASMTGTGSTLYGIFNADDGIKFPTDKEYFFRWIEKLD